MTLTTSNNAKASEILLPSDSGATARVSGVPSTTKGATRRVGMPLPGREHDLFGGRRGDRIGLAEPPGYARHVAAARQIDDDGIVRARPRIIASDGAAQARRLDAYDRIDLRIEGHVASQHLDADGVALQPLAVAAQHRFDDEQEEGGELPRTGEDIAGDHALDLRANFAGRRRAILLGCGGHHGAERLCFEAACTTGANAASSLAPIL